MRHTRKMVIIPEAEYKILLSLITRTSGDDLQNEKTKLDAKIANTLDNAKLDPDIKQKRYNVLYKQRRQMKDLIENRPQKVVIQNPETVPPNVAPYLGLSKLPNVIDPKSADDDRKKVISRSSTLASTSGTERSSMYTSSAPEDEGASSQYETVESSMEQYQMPSATRKKLIDLVQSNPKRFAIAPNGEILSYRKLNIKDSNFKASIDYIAGLRDSPPRGHKFFEQKLRKDPEAQKIIMGNFAGQSGQGKKHHKKVRFAATTKVGIIKTPGLQRTAASQKQNKKKFRPQLWAKL
jgi:hypothetical protein